MSSSPSVPPPSVPPSSVPPPTAPPSTAPVFTGPAPHSSPYLMPPSYDDMYGGGATGGINVDSVLEDADWYQAGLPRY